MLALLAKADRTAEERVGEKVVYEAMADTLSDAWGTLIAHLERRRSLLQHASEFFDRALEVNATVVQSRPNFHSVARVFFPPSLFKWQVTSTLPNSLSACHCVCFY